MSRHTQLSRDSYSVQPLCKTTFLHVRADKPFRGLVPRFATIRKKILLRARENLKNQNKIFKTPTCIT